MIYIAKSFEPLMYLSTNQDSHNYTNQNKVTKYSNKRNLCGTFATGLSHVMLSTST